MTLGLYLSSILLGLFNKKSKIILAYSVFCAWVLSAFASGNADSLIYENRYYYYDQFVGQTEPGFQWLMSIFNSFHIDYQLYRMAIIALELAFLVYFLSRITKNAAYALSIYLIFPFCMDVVQMRFALATSISLFGLTLLCKATGEEDCTKKRYFTMGYIAIIIIASFFHSVALLYLVLVFSLGNSSIKTSLLAVFISIFLAILYNIGIFTTIAELAGVGYKFENLRFYTTSAQLQTMLRVGITCGFNLLSCWFVQHHMKKDSITVDFVVRINLLMLCTIPLVPISADFYRPQLGLSLATIGLLSSQLDTLPRGRFSSNNFILTILLTAGAFYGLYSLVISNANFDTVLIPLFRNNTLLYNI